MTRVLSVLFMMNLVSDTFLSYSFKKYIRLLQRIRFQSPCIEVVSYSKILGGRFVCESLLYIISHC